MKKTILFCLCLVSVQMVFAQYWQQRVDYLLDVSLNEKERSLDGFAKITYFNRSPDTLRYIWFHLWPNAYKNDQTAFSEQALLHGDTRFYFSNREEKGYINKLDFKVDGITAHTEDHPQHIDITRLILPKPLPPGEQTVVTTPFHVKLPFNYSRGGYDGSTIQATQWYPKPAVYDHKGWHPMPYLNQGEFYGEFGKYDVRITIPEDYIVAATGELQNEDEKEKLLLRKNPPKATVTLKRTTTSATIKKPKPKSLLVKTKTLNFIQDQVHDFAWFANKDFIVDSDTCLLSSGNIVDVKSFYTEAEKKHWDHAVVYAKEALRFYSAALGEYPYKTASVVLGPDNFGGGMEYPTITQISPGLSGPALDEVVAHELGHNWFYGMLASNERLHPWMDEGMNTYYELRYMESRYGAQPRLFDLLLQTRVSRKTDQPVSIHSEQFESGNYGLSAYHKAASWMELLEEKMGKENFSQMMQDYFRQWKFRHPYPEDFQKMVRQKLGAETDGIFSLLNQKGSLPGQELKGFRVASPFKKGSIQNYLKHPAKNLLFLSPALGINSYDKLMLGAMVTNYKLPPNNFQFLLVPLYGLGSKKFTGLGRASYSIMSGGAIRKTDIFLNASSFTMNEFKDSADRKLFMQFQKLVPGIRLTLREKDPLSTVRKSIQFKSFMIGEETLRIRPDTSISGTDTSLLLRYEFPEKNRTLNQLQLRYENNRGLYPFDLTLLVEQGKDFIRTGLTGNYFFNYREGGLQLRVFAGKLNYLGTKTISKQFANDRYWLNMTGPKGFEDYTYSDYFLGRNFFEGLESQQIMIRDGGFKVRTDLLSSKIGKTDNWLAAINLNTSIPQKLNPLSALPLVKIPLHLFFDIGTYAEAWDKEADTDRFLYEFGFHIPLFNETVNFYFPIVYNKVYGDYFKSVIPKNRFFKTMSFSINLFNKDLKKLNREIEF